MCYLTGVPPLLGGLYLLWSLFLLKDPSQIQTFIDTPLGLIGGVSKFQKIETSSIHRFSDTLIFYNVLWVLETQFCSLYSKMGEYIM